VTSDVGRHAASPQAFKDDPTAGSLRLDTRAVTRPELRWATLLLSPGSERLRIALHTLAKDDRR
jgi:hypothetical protein